MDNLQRHRSNTHRSRSGDKNLSLEVHELVAQIIGKTKALG
jgi:hypothetical protein